MALTNTIAWDLTAEDTILGPHLTHEFKGSGSIPGISFTETIHVVSIKITEADGVVTIAFDVLGEQVYSHSFSEAGTHAVDLNLGSGSIKGTVTIS